MVNHGRSRGCVTCKKRRVKCDEARPECQSCRRLGLCCGGYKTKPFMIRFKDQSSKFCPETDMVKVVQNKQWAPNLRPLAGPDTAVPFFIRHYAIMGRDLASTRGFFEMLVPVYKSQRQNSALSLAVSAVASELLSLWRHDRSTLTSQDTYNQALGCLQRTMQDRDEWGKPATVLAALALQFYENIAAMYGRRSPTRVHHDGAASLLPFADSNCTNGTTSAYIRGYIIHSEISSAIGQKRLPKSTVHSCIGSNGPTAAPDNPSSTLDAIGASVAELQASYLQLETQGNSVSLSPGILRDWRAEAKDIDEQLVAWAQNLPEHWQALRLTSGQNIDPSIPTYQSICEVYPSCQIGTIWNQWRVQRILLAKIILGSLSINPFPGQLAQPQEEILASDEDFVKYKRLHRELVDSVCYSVPFFLGNQVGSLSIADFTDPAILFPSYHLLASGIKRSLSGQSQHASEEEHRSHLIAQGPWHIMNPLSRLLAWFSEEHGRFMLSFLRTGQHEWICEQFLRATVLVRIPLPDTGDAGGELSPFSSVNPRILDLAKRISKGADL